MALHFPFLILLLLFSSFFVHPSVSQSTPQNIQVYFPILTPPLLPFTPPTSLPTSPSTSSGKTVAKAVGITAAASLVLLSFFFLSVIMFKRRSNKETRNPYADNGINRSNNNNHRLRKDDEFVRVGGIKGVIVDEQGLDVFYWKRLEDYTSFKKPNLKINENERRNSKFDFPVQESPFLRGNSSTSHLSPIKDYTTSQSQTLPVVNPPKHVRNKEIIKSQPSMKCPQPSPAESLPNETVTPTAPLPLPPGAARPQAQPLPNAAVEAKKPLPPPPTAARPPSQPLPKANVMAAAAPPAPARPPVLPRSNAVLPVPPPLPPPLPPPPPALIVQRKWDVPTPPSPPPPSLIVERKRDIPLPPKTSGLTFSSGQPTQKDDLSSSNDNQVKFIPLHWDKVNTNLGHSMVWHKLHNGSFRVDDEKMESFFGTMTIDKKTPQKENSKSISPKAQMKSGPTQVFLLDTRKSQNIAIVVKSLSISTSKIIDCLLNGKNLDTDTLEKLGRITLSKEEVQTILEFEDDITKLADAESFLSHILKAVPLAFTRVNIMLFRSNFRSEVTEVEKRLQTLEMACKELKTQGLFVKLLEAVLKAGNRMNVGTARGNAQAFNLNSLLKLSDVKSSDGKTTLLHFVVEEVIRSEGKRCNIKRNHSSSRSTTGSLSGDETFTESYYIKLGLPVVGGVSSEFTNVRKAAGIDYDALSKSCLELTVHLAEITNTMEEFEQDGTGGGFVREIEMFLEGAKRAIQELRDEERRVMGVVRITNEYYQAGSSKDIIGGKQFQLFVIIKGFLDMVDKACLDIAIKMQKRRTSGGSTGRPPVKFLALPNFFRSSTSSSSSDSDESL